MMEHVRNSLQTIERNIHVVISIETAFLSASTYSQANILERWKSKLHAQSENTGVFREVFGRGQRFLRWIFISLPFSLGKFLLARSRENCPAAKKCESTVLWNVKIWSESAINSHQNSECIGANSFSCDFADWEQCFSFSMVNAYKRHKK